MAENTDPSRFEEISFRFEQNVSSVRIFASEIAPLGDEHDQAVAAALRATVREVVPDLPGIGDSDEVSIEVVPHFAQGNEPVDENSNGQSQEQRSITLTSEKSRALRAALRSFARKAPVQGQLLRNGALILLVSFLEILISELLDTYYSLHPEALPAESRSLTLAELRALGSIEEAERFLVSKEVDALLRESVSKQFERFRKLGVDLAPLEPVKDQLVEVSQRRNLCVHNAGEVNRYYLQTVSQDLTKAYGAVEGVILLSTSDYLETSLDVVQAAGVMLLQLCWRKWHKEELTQADRPVSTHVLRSAF